MILDDPSLEPNTTVEEVNPPTESIPAADISPSALPTAQPTPLALISDDPTNETVPSEPVSSQVTLVMRPASSFLIGDAEQKFLATTKSFLFSALTDVEAIEVNLLKQSRAPFTNRLLEEGDQTLYVKLEVNGRRLIREGSSTTSFFFEDKLKNAFSSQVNTYIDSLNLESEFFAFEEVSTFEPTLVTTSEPPAASPKKSLKQTIMDELHLILGIAGGVLVIICSMIIFCCFCRKSGKAGSHTSDDNSFDPIASEALTPKRGWRPRRVNDRAVQLEDDEEPLALAGSDLESQGLSFARIDSDSLIEGSFMHNGSVCGTDAMSYAYSLEPGIEPSVMSGIAGERELEVEEVDLRDP